MSSTLGRAADFETQDSDERISGSETVLNLVEDNDSFNVATAGEPSIEPTFETRYWCRSIPESLLNEWSDACRPDLPPPDSTLILPPKNPFVPENLALKPLPPDDSHHPLVNCSLKICITVGKKKVSSCAYFNVSVLSTLWILSPVTTTARNRRGFPALVPSITRQRIKSCCRTRMRMKSGISLTRRFRS